MNDAVVLLFLVAAVAILVATDAARDNQHLSNGDRCFLRCVAGCVADEKKPLKDCQLTCNNNETSCPAVDLQDWEQEKRLNVDISPIPNQNLNITWTSVQDAVFYVVQFTEFEDDSSLVDWNESNQILTQDPYLANFNASLYADFCSAKMVRIAPVKQSAVGGFTEEKIPNPILKFSSSMDLIDMVYNKTPFEADSYRSNGTVILTFRYDKTYWPLGDDDLIVEPMWHLIQCLKSDTSQAIPNPNFEKGIENTLIAKVGADMMYRSCHFLYYMSSMSSKRCGVAASNYSPPTSTIKELMINCSTVQNNDCVIPKVHAPPFCGVTNTLNYTALPPALDGNDLSTNITVNLTFVPWKREENQYLYYVAAYGTAAAFHGRLGVNVTKVLGEVNSCVGGLGADGTCKNHSTRNFVITNVAFDQLYGVVICGIRDVRNTKLPQLVDLPRAKRPLALGMEFRSKDYIKPNVGLYVGLSVAGLLLLFGIIAALSYWIYRSQKEKKLIEFSMKQMKRETEQRYTDFPKKSDLWELERRNLIIYDEKKLGSGAFGSVFLGKLIGKAKAHKDAQSALGVSLMRTENCNVAVKMLPEYADDMSKSEFLREIALMKNLGYHERLVNMLACITETEPYCLVVEYCSDGDLLHFLRERCEYMLRLDKVGVDYTDPEETNYELDMVITLKQLLMFAVQISYGLDYLAQKKYVHRDVAARNILVNDKNYAKIGDFGLCRFIYADQSNYISQGGRLPIKWMSPEAIRDYEFTCKSDVWAFGVLMFEIITLGGSPYPCIQPDDMYNFLDSGNRMEQPDNCPDSFYNIMMQCWKADPTKRPEFSQIRQKLASQLEEITDEYSYLKLDSQKDYYNVRSEEDTSDLMAPPDPEIAMKPFKASAQYSQDSTNRGHLDHSNSVSSEKCLITPSEPKTDWKKFDFDGFPTINEENKGFSNDGFQT